MTTLTTVIGLLPMLFAGAEGAEMQRPLGAVIVFGLSFATMITLILIPVLYLTLHNIRKKLKIKGSGIGSSKAESEEIGAAGEVSVAGALPAVTEAQ